MSVIQRPRCLRVIRRYERTLSHRQKARINHPIAVMHHHQAQTTKIAGPRVETTKIQFPAILLIQRPSGRRLSTQRLPDSFRCQFRQMLSRHLLQNQPQQLRGTTLIFKHFTRLHHHRHLAHRGLNIAPVIRLRRDAKRRHITFIPSQPRRHRDQMPQRQPPRILLQRLIPIPIHILHRTHPRQKLPHRLVPRRYFTALNGLLHQQTSDRFGHRKRIRRHQPIHRLKIFLAHQRIVAKHQKSTALRFTQHRHQPLTQCRLRSAVQRHQRRHLRWIIGDFSRIKPLVIQIVSRFLSDQIRQPNPLNQITPWRNPHHPGQYRSDAQHQQKALKSLHHIQM